MNASKALDPRGLRQGAAVALVFAVPFAIAAAVVNSNDDSSPWVAVLWLGALGGFMLGGAIAAWVQQTGLPIAHGMVCAGGTYLVTQTILTVVRLARGEEVSWIAIFFTFTMVMFAGLVGGALAGAMRKRGIVPGALSIARESHTEGGNR